MKESGLDLFGPERESALDTDRRRARIIALRACCSGYFLVASWTWPSVTNLVACPCFIRHEIERQSPHSPKKFHIRNLWHSDALPRRLENE